MSTEFICQRSYGRVLYVRLICRCLELVELLAMFAPGDVAENLAEVMPFLQV